MTPRGMTSAGRGRLMLWLGVSTGLVALDQLTKLLAEQLLDLHRPVPVVSPFFDLMLTYNEGAAFSLLGDAGGWQRWLFIGLAIVISVVLVVWLTRLEEEEAGTGWALTMILGGAVGNLIDRLFRDGRVVDFIYLHYQTFHWPAFNVADIAICVGAGALVVLSFRPAPGAAESG